MRRFTEDQAQRIFARAAERQHRAAGQSPGFSLDELTEIGRAAGLSDEHIAEAAIEVESMSPDELAREAQGLRTTVTRVRVLPGALTDTLWQGMVARLRRTTQKKGITSDVGAAREWMLSPSDVVGSTLHVTAEPVDGGTRVTLDAAYPAGPTQMPRWAYAALLAALAAFPVIGWMKDALDHTFVWLLPLLILLTVAGSAWFGRSHLRSWAERHDRDFDALLDQFEALPSDASSVAAGAPPTPTAADPLGLDDLAEAPESVAPGRSRIRS